VTFEADRGLSGDTIVAPDGPSHPDRFAPKTAADYFLIRARPPFRFTMVAACHRPWPDCTQNDPAIDSAPDLFGD
jgi:hypothetical protein